MNKTSLILFSVCVIFLCACGNTSSKKSKSSDKKTVDKVVVVKPDKNSGGIEKIPLFTECKNYNNDLSAIASEVEFAAFDMKLPLNDFHVLDVAITDKYIFLMEMHNIIQYDLNGKYIKTIGSKGRGPKEYVQLQPPLQLDRKNKLIYATDCRGNKVQVYDYEGNYKKTFPLTTAFMNARLIDSSTFAMLQHDYHRYRPNTPLVCFVDGKGKELKLYNSHIYPYDRKKMKMFGASTSFMWKNGGAYRFLEYGADTIFRIEKTELIPERVLTGKLKPSMEESFLRDIYNKVYIFQGIMRPTAGIFESDKFIVFQVYYEHEDYYSVYNKETKQFHRTFYKDIPRNKRGGARMNFFTDDMVSGMTFSPRYQSGGKAIALISAEKVVEDRDVILDFISKHPSKASERLKAIVEKMTEEDNPLMMTVKFK